MQNKVQLITYADRLGNGTLTQLRALIADQFKGLFGGIHILPFYFPIDGADTGFDPIDHTQVDPRLGEWDDIAALANDIPVMADVIVNHMSSESPQFKDFSRRGVASEFDGLFMTMDTVFPAGATEAELLEIYRPRPGLPFTSRTLENGDRKLLWTTFTPTQLDIDVTHAQGRAYLASILTQLARSGVTMIRLDAVGYAIKKAGASCFMMPETFEFIDEFARSARTHGLEVLVEVHSYYRRQIEIAERVDWVYDFALPPLVLHALYFKTSAPLAHWIGIRPTNALTVLDTHDGIGIIDIGADTADREHNPGLVPPGELNALVDLIHANSGGQSRDATGAAASNLDLYQVNCTFYDALGQDDGAYLIARAVQFFLPGVPQVYYAGLLAGQNDMALLKRSGIGRDINRHFYSEAEVRERVKAPVVSRLLELIERRSNHPAFNGRFTVTAPDNNRLTLAWVAGYHVAELSVDFAASTAVVKFGASVAFRFESIGKLRRA